MKKLYRLMQWGEEVHRGSSSACLKQIRAMGYVSVFEAMDAGYEVVELKGPRLVVNNGPTDFRRLSEGAMSCTR